MYHTLYLYQYIFLPRSTPVYELGDRFQNVTLVNRFARAILSVRTVDQFPPYFFPPYFFPSDFVHPTFPHLIFPIRIFLPNFFPTRFFPLWSSFSYSYPVDIIFIIEGFSFQIKLVSFPLLDNYTIV